MKCTKQGLIVVFIILVLLNLAIGAKGINRRKDKVFSLFNIVRFPNSACPGDNSYTGTCLTDKECSSKVKLINFIF